MLWLPIPSCSRSSLQPLEKEALYIPRGPLRVLGCQAGLAGRSCAPVLFPKETVETSKLSQQAVAFSHGAAFVGIVPVASPVVWVLSAWVDVALVSWSRASVPL